MNRNKSSRSTLFSLSGFRLPGCCNSLFFALIFQRLIGIKMKALMRMFKKKNTKNKKKEMKNCSRRR